MDEYTLDVLDHFEARAADDEVKIDLELFHSDCNEHVCDIEHGDTIAVLVRTCLAHAVECDQENT